MIKENFLKNSILKLNLIRILNHMDLVYIRQTYRERYNSLFIHILLSKIVTSIKWLLKQFLFQKHHYFYTFSKHWYTFLTVLFLFF